MSEINFRSELEMWQDLWDDAQDQGVHPSATPAKADVSSFSGDSAQDDYFDYLGSEIDDGLLQEDKIPNPVYPDSVGPDSDMDAQWVKEDFLKEIETLKNKLFAAENKLAKLGAGNKISETPVSQVKPTDDKIMAQIQSFRKQLEKVSNHLGIEDEASPWEIKRS